MKGTLCAKCPQVSDGHKAIWSEERNGFISSVTNNRQNVAQLRSTKRS